MANTASSSNRDYIDNGCSTDYSSEFKTTQKFTSREELGEWVCKVGRSNGFGMVTLRSDGGGGNSKKRPRVTLGCERSGKPDPRLPGPEKKIRKGSGSKKCGCPFILKGQLAADGSGWELTEVKGVHNHAVESSDFPARLTKEEKSLVKNMHSENLKPKEILKDLKERDKHNKSTLRTIYNARKSLDGKRVQQGLSLLFNKLSLHGHIHCDMTCPKTNTRNFFLTNPTSLKLLRAFPSLLKITFGLGVATDRDLHLCITGITSTEIQFSVAFVYLCSQRRDNLLWALNRLRDEMDDIAVLRVIVLQIEFRNVGAVPGGLIGLIGAIKDVFRTTEVLLCGSFVTRVLFNAYGRERFFKDLYWTHFQDLERKWETLVQSPSESEFKKKLTELQTEFKMYPELLDYLTKTWLNPLKQKFVAAWTNKFCHLGIQTPFEWGRYHTIFQARLIDAFYCTAESEFESMSKEIHRSLEWEHKTICDSFKESLAAAEIDDFIRFPELKEFIGVVSINALRLVRKQCLQALQASDVIISVDCDCAIRCTHGLPCHHDIAKYNRDGQPIPAECIRGHWKTINLPFLTQAVEMMGHHPSETSMDKETKEYIEDDESVESESPIMAECARQPEEKEYHIQTHNAIGEFAEACPASLRDYVHEVKDVASDGHCGFRAISSLLGYDDEGGWVKVRKDLIDELSFNKAHYAQLYSSNQRVEELLHSLNYFHSTCLHHKEHWMTMPDIGNVVASCYNVILMHLSFVQCFTFLPLRTAPISISSPKEIAIGFLNEHFVQVILKQDHPMPPPAPTPTIRKLNMSQSATDWERFHQQRCREWANRYTARMEEFKSLQPEVILQKNPTVIDTDLLPPDDGDDFFQYIARDQTV